MNYFKKNLHKIILLAFIFVLPVLSLAQDCNGNLCPKTVTIVNPLGTKTTTINDFIKILLEGAIKIGMPVITLAVIYSGFLFVSAQGKPESIKKAKDALLYTLIGAAILLGSWAIAQLIADTVKAL
ncbi:MAG: hypothetical protein AAB913_00550 [Patescibacteria group bacterium]